MTYQVKNRFQNVPFKRKLQRYSADGKGWLFSHHVILQSETPVG
jgi:hypothetical protein